MCVSYDRVVSSFLNVRLTTTVIYKIPLVPPKLQAVLSGGDADGISLGDLPL